MSPFGAAAAPDQLCNGFSLLGVVGKVQYHSPGLLPATLLAVGAAAKAGVTRRQAKARCPHPRPKTHKYLLALDEATLFLPMILYILRSFLTCLLSVAEHSYYCLQLSVGGPFRPCLALVRV